MVAFGKTLALFVFIPLAATEEGDEVMVKVGRFWLARASAEASAAASAEAFSSIMCCQAQTNEYLDVTAKQQLAFDVWDFIHKDTDVLNGIVLHVPFANTFAWKVLLPNFAASSSPFSTSAGLRLTRALAGTIVCLESITHSTKKTFCS